jgi:hypothetical protein
VTVALRYFSAPVWLGSGSSEWGARRTLHAPPPYPLRCRPRSALCEEKDAKEREAKAARRAGGKAVLKSLLADRAGLVAARKQKNREDEAAKEREAMDALEGESWGRVVSLVDVSGTHTGGTDKAAAKKAADAPEPEMARQKDILIALKNTPLPAAQ